MTNQERDFDALLAAACAARRAQELAAYAALTPQGENLQVVRFERPRGHPRRLLAVLAAACLPLLVAAGVALQHLRAQPVRLRLDAGYYAADAAGDPWLLLEMNDAPDTAAPLPDCAFGWLPDGCTAVQTQAGSALRQFEIRDTQGRCLLRIDQNSPHTRVLVWDGAAGDDLQTVQRQVVLRDSAADVTATDANRASLCLAWADETCFFTAYARDADNLNAQDVQRIVENLRTGEK